MADIVTKNVRGYELLEVLGEGGFGKVYRAYQPLVKREVAIKVIVAALANRPEFVRSFETEAQIIAQLEHLHIIPLYDFWRDPSGAYLVMRFLRGGSLESALKTAGQMKLPAALQLLDQVCSALNLAHQSGVVHGDIKPANILLDNAGNGYLSDFGIASNFKQHDAPVESGLAGTPAYIAPEQIQQGELTPATDIYSLAVMAFEILSGHLPFEEASVSAFILKHLTAEIPNINKYCPDFPPAVNDVLRMATKKDPAQRFQSAMAFSQALHEAFEKAEQIAPAVHENVEDLVVVPPDVKGFELTEEMLDLEVATEIPNPYKGLRAFQQGDAKDFFGRAALIDELVNRMKEPTGNYRFLAVVGPSGSGKSSVVKAGLLPALKRGAVPGSEHYFIVEMMPGSDVMRELENALLSVAVQPPKDLHERLGANSHNLHEIIKEILPDSTSEFLLLIDQFEELFTLTADNALRIHFMDSLQYAITAPDSRLRVIITIRADFYDKPLLYPEFGALIRERTELVLPLNKAELEEAITGPVTRVGVRAEPQLVQTIVSEVSEEPGALPLLQYALTENFERRLGRMMTLESYQASGGVLGSLARRAEELYTQMSTPQQEAIRQLFLRLVTLGEGTEDTRRRILWSELAFTGEAEDPLRHVLDTYVKYRLLTIDKDPHTREPTVEVAHEALIRQWQRLRQWLQNSREDLRTQRRLATALQEWRASKKDNSFLASGVRLQQLEALANNVDIALTNEEKEYITASVAKRELDRSIVEKQKARELALERRSARIFRALVVVFAVFAVVGIGLAWYASIKAQEADVARGEAITNLERSRLLRLAVESNNLLESGVNTEVASLLSIRSLSRLYTDQSYNAAVRASTFNAATMAISAHSSTINHIVYSPDGRYVLSSSDDKTAGVWDTQTGKEVVKLSGHKDGVFNAAFSPDGKYILTAGRDKTSKLWDAKTGKLIRDLVGDGRRPWGAAFSPDSKYALIGFGNAVVWVWETETGNTVTKLQGHGDYVLDIRYSHDGKTILTTSGDKTARLWNANTGAVLQVFSGHTNEVWSGSFSPDDKTVVTASWDGSVRLWDVATGKEIRQFYGHTDKVNSVMFSPDGKYILSASSDRTARLWNVETGQEVQRFASDTQGLMAATFSPDGKSIATGGAEGVLRLWPVNLESRPGVFRGSLGTINAVEFSPDGKYVLTGGGDRIARLWDARTGALIRVFPDHQKFNGVIWSVAFSPDGRYAATSADDRRVILWDVASGANLHVFVEPDQKIWDVMNQVGFSPDGRYLLTSSKDKTAKIWDVQTYEEKLRITQKVGIFAAAFSPDGKNVAIGMEDGSLLLWNIQSNKQVQAFVGHKANVFRVAFSPDGKRLVSGSEDGTVRLWDVTLGTEIHTFTGFHGQPTAAFSPNGKYILTGSHQSGAGATLWDAQTFERISTVFKAGAIQAVAFSPDGVNMLIGGNDNLAWLIPAEYHTLIAQMCRSVYRDFTDNERTQYDIQDKDGTCPQFNAPARLFPPTMAPAVVPTLLPTATDVVF